jgi:hypothetical protein
MLQSNPSDATASFVQPDWNSKTGVGVAIPAARDESRDLTDVYLSQKAGAKIIGGPGWAGQTPPAPTVGTVSPTGGGVAGGTVVTIVGTNLHATSAVTFGGTAGTNLRVKNTTTVTVTAPAKTAGAITVAVTTPGGTGSKTTGYTYA